MPHKLFITSTEIDYLNDVLLEASNIMIRNPQNDEETKISAAGLTGVIQWLSVLKNTDSRKIYNEGEET